MLFGNDFSCFQIDTDTNKQYYLGEEVLHKYIDEYRNIYFMTKGLNRYYLYKKAVYGDYYAEVADGKNKILNYIKNNNLKEVIN